MLVQITIPKGADAGFDLNEFAVRIMSVDYQTMARYLIYLLQQILYRFLVFP